MTTAKPVQSKDGHLKNIENSLRAVLLSQTLPTSPQQVARRVVQQPEPGHDRLVLVEIEREVKDRKNGRGIESQNKP